MKQNLKDAIQCAGFAVTLFALWKIGTFTGFAYWVVLSAIYLFLLATIIEVVYPKLLE